jgi:oligopeptide/dipeptide ABC transporter ATP-binding protein
MSDFLEIDNLSVTYPARGGAKAAPGTASGSGPRSLAGWLKRQGRGTVHAVNGVSLSVAKGEIIGLVGESGCGKSTLGRAILGLTPASAGAVRFDGGDMLSLRQAEMLAYRRRAQMVFQDPFASLNPRLTVYETLAEVLQVHRICARSQIRAQVMKLLEQVGLPAEFAHRKARSLSGGQCQRVGIARALAVGAELIIADEPISALDVSIQAQILNLFSKLQRERNLTIIFVSHDLGVVRYLCRRVAVMYLGRIVEEGPAEDVFAAPLHPYTKSLAAAIPQMSPEARLTSEPLAGEPPSPLHLPSGCAFHPRCPQAMPQCRAGAAPAPRQHGTRQVWCHLYPAIDGAPNNDQNIKVKEPITTVAT